MKKRHKVLFQQLESYRGNIVDVLETITEEKAEIVPEGFKNNIRWHMGHIFLDQYLWIEALTKEKSEVPKQFNNWFGFGTSPANFSTETPTFHELKELLKIQPSKIKDSYGNRLEEEFPQIEMGMFTIEHVLIRTIFHEGMHLQAILDIKKVI